VKLSYSEIMGLWIRNGGSVLEAPLMAAIGLAESGGETTALNDSGRDYSIGIWQINYYGDLRSSRTRAFGTPESLRKNPDAQAKAAVSIRKSQGLDAWTTYTRGDYKRFLNASTTPTLADTTATGDTDETCAWKIQIPASGDRCVFSKTQMRSLIGGILVVSAAVVVIVGGFLMISQGKAGKVVSLLPVGRVGKVMGAMK